MRIADVARGCGKQNVKLMLFRYPFYGLPHPAEATFDGATCGQLFEQPTSDTFSILLCESCARDLYSRLRSELKRGTDSKKAAGA